MGLLPAALQNVIDDLGKLPGVGPRTAERYAYYLLRADQSKAHALGRSLDKLHDGIGYCQKTFALVKKGQELSPLYTDPERDKKLIAVVAEPFDIVAIEKTAHFKGTYHVLGGLVSPIDGIGPENLHIKELLKRVEEDHVVEIILATSASVEGESTALYIQKELAGTDVKMSRLARGLSVGLDIEYADQLTLTRAIEDRQAM